MFVKYNLNYNANTKNVSKQGGTPNEVEIFEKVLGPRRGHIKGIGPKPSQVSSWSFDKGQSSSTSQSQYKEVVILLLFKVFSNKLIIYTLFCRKMRLIRLLKTLL